MLCKITKVLVSFAVAATVSGLLIVNAKAVSAPTQIILPFEVHEVKPYDIKINLGLTQSKLIKKLKVKEPLYAASISQYERGKREPSLLVLLAYARLAQVSVESLIDDKMEVM